MTIKTSVAAALASLALLGPAHAVAIQAAQRRSGNHLALRPR